MANGGEMFSSFDGAQAFAASDKPALLMAEIWKEGLHSIKTAAAGVTNILPSQGIAQGVAGPK